MNQENDYLVYANQLKEQYNQMKAEYEERIRILEERIQELENDLASNVSENNVLADNIELDDILDDFIPHFNTGPLYHFSTN